MNRVIAINRVIAVVNRKGGSAKTVTCFNLAGALAESGQRVLVIDLDPQGSLSKGLALQAGDPLLSAVLLRGGEGFDALIQETRIPNLYAIPADRELNAIESGLREIPGRELRLRRCLSKSLSREFDTILVDCPPSLGSLTQNALVAAGEVLIPVDCGSYGRDALGATLDVIQFIREEINYNLKILGVLICNVNPHTTFDALAEAAIREQFGELVFKTVIPNSIKIDESSEAKQPLVFYARTFPLAERFRELARDIAARGQGAA
jgi:chromosome partitioning protein